MLILFNYLIHSIKNNNIKLIQRQLIPSFLQFHFNANEIDWKDGGGAYAAAAVAFTSSTFFSIQLIPLQQPAIAHIWWNNVIITVWLYHCTVIIQFNSFKLFMNLSFVVVELIGEEMGYGSAAQQTQQKKQNTSLSLINFNWCVVWVVCWEEFN